MPAPYDRLVFVRAQAVRGRVVRLLGLSAALALALYTWAATSGAASLRHELRDPGTSYASIRPVCSAPAPHEAQCLALELVPAAAGAEGAVPYTRAAGATSVGPAGGLTPADLASAYGYTGAVGGAGQTVAIVDAYDDPKIEADLAAFDANYGLDACTQANGCFTKVGQSGSTSALPAADTRGWTVEIALDVETVHSACPNCKIVLVEASSEALGDLALATDEAVALGAGEVSNSYGALENEMGTSERSAYDHPGVVIAAAAGDSGYLNWDRLAETGVAPGLADAPAALPTVLAVGGTSLKLTTAGRRANETVWNDSGPPSGSGFKQFAATGGGCSTLAEAPAWQQTVPGWAATGCGSHRLDSDVAAVADPYTGFDLYSSYKYAATATTGWQTVGGTSLSSPLIAALYGLAGGARGASYPAATLYTHLGASSLYDVTKGGDGYCDAVEASRCGEPALNEEWGPLDCVGTASCDAGAGFDGPAGVGTPNGLEAFGAPPAPTVLTRSATNKTPSSATLNASVTPNGTAVVSCTFEWGPTSALGHGASCATAPGAGSSPVAVSAAIGGLAASTYYYFRISATNATVRATGKVLKLKTPA